jgi:hypothetical protein
MCESKWTNHHEIIIVGQQDIQASVFSCLSEIHSRQLSLLLDEKNQRENAASKLILCVFGGRREAIKTASSTCAHAIAEMCGGCVQSMFFGKTK